MDDEMIKKMALLEALRRQTEPDESDDSDIYVSSVRDASVLLQQHMIPSGARYRKRLVEFITDPQNRVLSEGTITTTSLWTFSGSATMTLRSRSVITHWSAPRMTAIFLAMPSEPAGKAANLNGAMHILTGLCRSLVNVGASDCFSIASAF